jgi:CRISPR-associated exonuclease Cas4
MSVWAWIIVVVALLQIRAWRRRRAARAERMSRPRELRDAELMYMEKRFRIRRPVHLVAQLDRAYRAPDGALVLVELKTRWGGPQLSDIIQMSAQRMVVEGETGQPVARHGFVMVERPDAQRSLRSHRVQLWDAAQMVALARRREAVLNDLASPRHAARIETCRRCLYRSECDRFV